MSCLPDLIFETRTVLAGHGPFRIAGGTCGLSAQTPDYSVIALVGHTDTWEARRQHRPVAPARRSRCRQRLTDYIRRAAGADRRRRHGISCAVAQSNLTDEGREANRRVEAISDSQRSRRSATSPSARMHQWTGVMRLPVSRAFVGKGMHQEVDERAHLGLGEPARRIDCIDALRFQRQDRESRLRPDPVSIASA